MLIVNKPSTKSLMVSLRVILVNNDSHQEAATRGVLYKKMFLEISQNSQEKTCAIVSFLIKLQA